MHLQLLDPNDAATLLGCTAESVEDLLRAGVLPGVKFGRSWRIPAGALDARLNELALQEAEQRRGQAATTPTTPVQLAVVPTTRRRAAPPLN